MASAGTVESFVQSSVSRGDTTAGFTGQALLQKLEGDLEALESHLVDLNRYSERLTSEYNEKVSRSCQSKSQIGGGRGTTGDSSGGGTRGRGGGSR